MIAKNEAQSAPAAVDAAEQEHEQHRLLAAVLRDPAALAAFCQTPEYKAKELAAFQHVIDLVAATRNGTDADAATEAVEELKPFIRLSLDPAIRDRALSILIFSMREGTTAARRAALAALADLTRDNAIPVSTQLPPGTAIRRTRASGRQTKTRRAETD